ncbi:MAG: hypothetical protein MJH10_09585 [Epibacterium sp.]|nr:hypothetical protein [Epibacterium sp.]NQX73786.1 hypothetical protein [Epibacterium sp.]
MSEKWKKTKHKKGTIYSETDRNSWLAQVNIRGKTYRRRCKTKIEAQNFIEMCIQVGELDSPPLTTHGQREAVLSRDLLGEGKVLPFIKSMLRLEERLPEGVSIDEAVDGYIGYKEEEDRLPEGVNLRDAVTYYLSNNTITEQITVSEAVDRFLDRKSKSNLRERTLMDYTSRLEVLREEIGDQLLSDLKLSDLEGILDDYLWKPRNQNNYRNTWITLFEFCRKRQLITTNPAQAIDVLPVDAVVVKPYTVEECESYLRAAESVSPGFTPFLALGFFAGIRTAELERMNWDQVGAEVINIAPDGSKVRSEREIPISDNLHRWLDKHRESGPILKAGSTHFHDYHKPRILEVAKIQPPPRNVARKSYASYHYALTGSASRTAANMGTSESKVFSNYRGKVSQKDAERYFSIVPA